MIHFQHAEQRNLHRALFWRTSNALANLRIFFKINFSFEQGCVALPRGSTGLSAVCDCGIS